MLQKIRMNVAVLLGLAVFVNQSRAVWIDDFTVGAQNLTLVGGTYPSDHISAWTDGLDAAHVFSGARSVGLYADLQGPFRSLVNADNLSAVINGATPGTLACVVNVTNEVGGGAYHPGLRLNYWSNVALDWSAYDRLVIAIASPASHAMTVSVNMNWSSSGGSTELAINPGDSEIEVPFSAFAGLVAAEMQGVSLEFRVGAELEAFTLGGIRLVSGGALPRLDMVLNPTNSVILSWPASAAGFVAQQSATLIPSAWADIAPPYQTNAAQITVAVPLAGTSGFYRLRQAQ